MKDLYLKNYLENTFIRPYLDSKEVKYNKIDEELKNLLNDLILKPTNDKVDRLNKFIDENKDNLNIMYKDDDIKLVDSLYAALDYIKSSYSDEVIIFLKNFMSKYMNHIKLYSDSSIFHEVAKDKIDNIDTLSNSKLVEIKNNIFNIYDKLLNNEEITIEEHEFLINLINSLNDSIDNKLDLIESLTNIIYLNNEEKNMDDEVDLIPENNEHIPIDKLISLFKEFGYDDNFMNETNLEFISTYGNYDNIRNIFIIFRDCNYIFNLNDPSNEESNVKLAKILVYAKAKDVLKVVNNIKEDIKSNKTSDSLNDLLSDFIDNYLLFIWNSRATISKDKIKNNTSDVKKKIKTINGTFTNYDDFRNYIIDNNITDSNGKLIDVNNIVKKCAHVFAWKAIHLERRLKYLVEYYHISVDDIFKAPTCLGQDTPLDTIDQFIEVGCEDYIKNNLSRIASEPGSPLLYKLSTIFKKTNEEWKEKTIPITISQDPEFKKLKNESRIDEALGYVHFYDNDPNLIQKKMIFDKTVLDEMNHISPKSLNTILDDPFIKILDDEYKVDDTKYEFITSEDKILIISRYKVLRNYMILKNKFGDVNADYRTMLLYSITKNSFLTEDDLNSVESIVDEVISKTLGKGLKGE